MPRLMPARQLALKAGAAVFLIAACAYSVGLIYYNRHSFPTATAGATYRFDDADRGMRVTAVTPGRRLNVPDSRSAT